MFRATEIVSRRCPGFTLAAMLSFASAVCVSTAMAAPISFVKATIDPIPADAGQDPTPANTTLADGTALVLDTHYTGVGAEDGMWGYRASSIHIGSTGDYDFAFGSRDNGTNDENSPRLRTTVSGLTAGETYEMFAYFLGNAAGISGGDNQDFRVRAGLTDSVGELPLFTQRNDNPAGTQSSAVPSQVGDPTPDLLIPEGLVLRGVNGDPNVDGTFLLQASLGMAVADGLGQVHVYIDDDISAVGNFTQAPDQTTRSTYTGVGYSLVVAQVPEPTSVAMLGAGALLFVGMRARTRHRKSRRQL